MLEKFIRHIQSHKKLHLSWIIAVTAIMAVCIIGIKINGREIIKPLKIDNSMEVWFRDDDPDWLSYKKFQEKFEGDEFIVVALPDDNIFSPEILKKIKGLTNKFSELPYIIEAISLTNIDYFQGDNGILKISEMFEKIPDDPAELLETKEKVLKNPLYTGNVISEDGKTAAILIRVEKQPQGIPYQRQLTDLVYKICGDESEGGKYKFHVSGAPILMGLEDKATQDDSIREYALLFLMIVLFLYFVYRRIIYVVIPLTVIAIANIWIHGIINICGSTYNMITNIIAVLVMVIGIADSMHFISEYDRDVKDGKKNTIAAADTLKILLKPLFFACITTVVGFMSMGVTPLKALTDFGIYSGIAILFAFIINVILLTIWLSSLDEKVTSVHRKHRNSIGQKFINWVSDFNKKHVKINLVFAVVIFLVSFTGLVRIETNTHEIKYFKEDHPIRISTEFIEKNLTGTIPLEIMLTGPEDSFRDPATLRRIEELQAHIKKISGMQKTFSVVDYLKEINRVIHDENPEFYRIPDSANAVSQLLLLTEGDNNEIEQYVNLSDFKIARIHSRLNYVDTDTMQAIVDSIDKKIKELFNSGAVRAEITGMIPMYLHATDYLIDSQISGFGTALITITIIIMILVRSIKLGLIAMVPNVIPIFLTFGIMGWLNIYLDLGTVLIASIAIGLADDDTIHFLTRFKHFFDRKRNYDEAVQSTFKTAGLEIVDSSTVLFFGFGALTISTFVPAVNFGILCCITMASAIIADLFVTPALLKIFKPFGPEEASEKEKLPEEKALYDKN